MREIAARRRIIEDPGDSGRAAEEVRRAGREEFPKR